MIFSAGSGTVVKKLPEPKGGVPGPASKPYGNVAIVG